MRAAYSSDRIITRLRLRERKSALKIRVKRPEKRYSLSGKNVGRRRCLGTGPSVRGSRGHVCFLKYLFTRIAGFRVETREIVKETDEIYKYEFLTVKREFEIAARFIFISGFHLGCFLRSNIYIYAAGRKYLSIYRYFGRIELTTFTVSLSSYVRCHL